MSRPIRDVAFERILDKADSPEPSQHAVTVAISLFNYERFVVDCLDSVRDQTHTNIELVVVDDASQNDDSVGVAKEWITANSARFDRTVLVSHTENQGLAQARNTAFQIARTDLVFVLDADNILYPRAISRLYDVMKHLRFDAAYTQIEKFGDVKAVGSADIWSKAYFLKDNYVDAMALISKRAWRHIGGYQHIEGGWEDYDFWCTFVDEGMRAAFVPEMLCRYRVHGTSMLNAETKPAVQRIIVEMCLRHPWLKL